MPCASRGAPYSEDKGRIRALEKDLIVCEHKLWAERAMNSALYKQLVEAAEAIAHYKAGNKRGSGLVE
jgi:hypothetical protein